MPRPLLLCAVVCSVLVCAAGCGAAEEAPLEIGAAPQPVERRPPQRRPPRPAPRAAEPKRIGAKHILVMHDQSERKPDAVHRTMGDALIRARECLARIRAGADFDDLVGEFSDEPGAADRHGDLGTFEKQVMIEPFAQAAFALEVGQVSDVVETPFGYHIIKRTE